MIRFLIDQNFNRHIVNGLIGREEGLNVLHVRDLGLSTASDPEILEVAARLDRILLTHDRKTMPTFAHDRVNAGQPMPGVFLVSGDMPVRDAIEEIYLALHCLTPAECRDIVKYLPI